MSREQLIEEIKDMEKKFSDLFIKANGTEIRGRIGLHIAEARLLLKLEKHMDDEGLVKGYGSLVENYYEIIKINSEKKYFIS